MKKSISRFRCGAGATPASLDRKQARLAGEAPAPPFFHSFTRPLLFFVLILLLTSTASAASTVSVSILSILQPTELSITLLNPSRAMLSTSTSQNAIISGTSILVSLHNKQLNIEPAELSASSASIQCEKFCELELSLKGLPKRIYKGNLKLQAGSTIQIVLLLEEQDYLASIVASEMGESRNTSSLEAFSVVARSFYRAGARHPESGAHACDLTHCQVFQAYSPTDEARSAVQKTESLVLTYRNQPFRPYYFRNCGGSTASFAEVWGKPLPDYPFQAVKCVCSEKWDTQLGASELEKILGFHPSQVSQDHFYLSFSGAGGKQSRYSLEEFRTLAGRSAGWQKVRSNNYIVNQSGSGLHLRGKGNGHRVGFCQNGSIRMSGTFQEILQHYFPNTEIKILSGNL